MIITKLQGGLGNQMFQYAIGRNLAIKNNTALKLDIDFYKNSHREYSLACFNIDKNISTAKDLRAIGLPPMEKTSFPARLRRKLFRLLDNIRPINRKKIILEPHFNFFSEIFGAKDNCFISGNWQSEKYFKDIADIIRKDFTLKNQLSPESTKWQKKIEAVASVSLHIRRGDYVTNAKANEFHGTCSLAYYEEAIKIIANKIKTPEIFVFSDDISWAKDNLRLDYPTNFVSSDAISDYEEMILMSMCRHNIIANSSFSWWGAWLNPNSDKTIIAPKKWFNNTTTDTSDLLPESWLKI